MADISKLEEQANLLMSNVSGWETSTLERIGKRIKKYGKLSLADVKSINNIAIVKQDMDAITKELAKVTGYNISQIEQMYGELLEEQHLANQPLYDYRGKTFVPFKDNRELQAIVRAYAKTTGETMINLAKTKALCVLDHNGNVKGLQKYYTDVLDKAVMQVTTGATDFHTAMRDSIIELGGSGVRVDYGGGVTRRLDTVVRQNLLWGAKQASVEYNEMIGEELGCDGYEVDWHSNPRPSHEFMQGKQYVLGKARTINGVYFESADEALERLQDYGCLHYKTPIICGISEPRYSAEELKRLNEQNAKRYTIDGKEYSGYEVTQMQRRLESSVRNEKTTRELAKASGDTALVKRCNERIKAYQGKYNEISEITGIQGDKKRMSVTRGTATVNGEMPTPKKVEPSFATDIQGKKMSPYPYSYTNYDSYKNAKNAFQGQETEYLDDVAPKTKIDWGSRGSDTNKISPQIDSTLAELYKKYPLSKEYGDLVVCDYDNASIFLKNGSLDRRLSDSATAQVFLEDGKTIIAFRGSSIYQTFDDTIQERLTKLSKGEVLMDVAGASPQGVAIHEWGHTVGEHISQAMVYDDADAIEYWEWYKSLSKDDIRQGLSDYATTNRGEFEAECFAEALMPNPRPIALKYMEFVSKIMSKGY